MTSPSLATERDGTTTIGIYRPATGTFYLSNQSAPGYASPDAGIIRFGDGTSDAAGGLPYDIPVVGDWNGDGRDTVGVVR